MRIHLIAIGGAVMHNLALELLELGHIVTGSDDEIWEPSRSRLAQAGLLPENTGWFPEKITQNIDLIIVGMHAKADNPELSKAKELKINTLSFPEFIFQHAKHKQRIVIAGSHGKTTTTSIILHILKENNIEVDFLVGSILPGFKNMVHLTEHSSVLIAEGDEYLASPMLPIPKFLVYQPHMVVITGISWDHINVFQTEEIYHQQFEKLVQQLPKAGTVIYNAEDAQVSSLVQKYTKPDIHYAVPYETISFKYKNIHTEYRLAGEKGTTQLFGSHNFANISAAWQVCRLLGLSPHQFIQAMVSFQGPDKRMQLITSEKNGLFIQDFAHAPSKVNATVDAVLSKYDKKEVIACLELHTFSSLNSSFLKRYAGSLSKAAKKFVFISDHALKLKKLPAIADSVIQEGFQDLSIIVLRNKKTLTEALKPLLNPKTVLLLMSSGSFDGLKINELTN